jgi:hypothetical protein
MQAKHKESKSRGNKNKMAYRQREITRRYTTNKKKVFDVVTATSASMGNIHGGSSYKVTQKLT